MRFSVHTTLEAVRKALENANVKFLNASKGGGAAGASTGVAKMQPINPASSVITEQLTRALGEAVIAQFARSDAKSHLIGLAISGDSAHIAIMSDDSPELHLKVRHRNRPPKPYKWEIY